ncbi:MAG: biotin carboxylase N-terminal domain-containing protein, partial [Ferrovibrio sp.]
MSRLPFDTLLIANRGEIALRIIRTARRMGLRTVVVAHEADRGAPALATADEVVWIEGRTGVAAYLDGAQIIDAARRAGAGAIHPGYGFLSENAGFAAAVAAAGMAFVGPTPEAIDLMGDKIRARAFVKLWTAFVVLAIYLPIVCGALAGLSKGRYFAFPIRVFSTEWWGKTLASYEIQTLVQNSLLIAFIVTLVSVVFAFFGALAFARYDWKGRKLF